MNKINIAGVDKATWVRTILLVLAMVNSGLKLMGYDALPIEDEQVNDLVSAIFLVVTSVIAWWENNSFTQKAQEADKVIKGE